MTACKWSKPGLSNEPCARCRHLAPEFPGARCSLPGDMKVHWVQLTLSIIWHEKSVSPAVHFICVQISTIISCCYFFTLDFINHMTWEISFPCGALYLHFIRCCSWLYALNQVDFINDGMKDQFSMWCTLFGLHFICSARSTTKLTGWNRTYPHYLPICQGNCILFHILQR